ncbi:MAG: FAD-binding and (Fe-S)-binding domain-containing protein [Candidatus Pseudobacter hemicellulosilyticus]|uniref:D-lactate dehydrogenase (cytochrome) n=1 Tax=Candidatus Pseudobacter hemicellulosilyticus TaxID=3121375 RepID=A0AAJ5WRJ9_9BACT|nr:MAG: FAD-binding and (Fe-S)-binding domain-containing protein [Pseudobacter sp.]
MEQTTDTGRLLEAIMPASRIKTRLVDLVSYASDAGFYQLVPRAVVLPVDEAEIIALFRFSHQHRIPLVFRGGGTSLSGQSITDGILVDIGRYWRGVKPENEGRTVRVQPGITGSMVNAQLRRYGRKIGPDPSSIGSAMMGGILSNNASGMCCGVRSNAYHTTKYIRFILPDGNTFSTELAEDYTRFAESCRPLHDTLLRLRQQVLADATLFERIRKKYQTKNTVGYSLNALIDHAHPLDILAHLLIGGEGTLAFIAEAVLDTVPEPPFKATALLYFPDIYAACKAIIPLIGAGAEMVELMDRASLHAIEDLPGMMPVIKTLPGSASALLIEFQESTAEALATKLDLFLASAEQLSMLNMPVFTTDPKEREFLWKVRKGLFPAVGAVRASGTTVILEDIAFPLEHLGDAILELQKLFRDFGYHDAIIFGHAKDGNLHFVVKQSFHTPEEVTRYDRFMQAVVALVVKQYDGALKAEHGTGRNMAPFVETEWGTALYAIMQQLKQAIDPMGLLNPGVIINTDPKGHIRHLKSLPSVEGEVDRCIECGFCETVCPSRDLTLTPRRRIVVRRALVGLKVAGRQDQYDQLLKEYQYDGLDTCAVDGLCASNCPVDINTGDLVKRLRRESHDAAANKLALRVAKNFGLVERSVRMALRSGSLVNSLTGGKGMPALTKGLRWFVPTIPLWSPQIPGPPSLSSLRQLSEKTGSGEPVLKGTGVQTETLAARTIVYFPSCISRVMGSHTEGKKNILDTFLSVARKAGVQVLIPKDLQGSCCGQIFSSKGFQAAYSYTANKIVDSLWSATASGLYPVIMDVSSCVYTLKHLRPALSPDKQQLYDQLRILDSVDFLHDMVLPVAGPLHKKENIVLHPVCSLKKLGTEDKFVRIARHFANEVTVPVQAGCCGMAGDRGFLFPELTAAATSAEAAEVSSQSYNGYYSSTKTCEMALSEATKANYESILYLADEVMA